MISTAKEEFIAYLRMTGGVIPNPLLFFTSCGKLLYANEAAQKQFLIAEESYSLQHFQEHFRLEGLSFDEIQKEEKRVKEYPVQLKKGIEALMNVVPIQLEKELLSGFLYAFQFNTNGPGSTNEKACENQDGLEVRISDELLHHALDVADLYFFSLDFSNKSLFIRKEIKALLGLKAHEEITIDNFREFIYPEDYDSILKQFEDSLVTQTFDFEFRVKSRKNCAVWVRARGVTSLSYDGMPEKLEGMVQDISPEKNKEITLTRQKQLLEQSEARLSRAEKVSKMGHWAINLEDLSYEWSKGAYEVYGIPEGTEITDQVIASKIHPEDLTNTDLQYPLPLIVRHRIIVGGKIKWVQVETDPNYVSDQQLFGTIRDITDEVKQNEQLELYNKQLNLAIHGAGAGFFTYDIVLDQNYWDEKSSELFGLPPRARTCNYKELMDHILPEDRVIFDRLIQANFENKSRLNVTFRILVNGKIRHINKQGTIAYNAKGKAIKIQGIHLDITNELEAKALLLESENKYRSIFENISEGYLQLDTAGKCLNANPAACSLLREKHPDKIIGFNFFRKYLYNNRDLNYLRNLMKKSREVNGVEILLKRADGSTMISDFHLKLVTEGDQIRIEGTFRDITKEVEINDYILSATIEAEDKQRRTIALNLHDGVQQTLIAAKMNLESLRSHIDQKYLARFEAGISFINQGVNEIRAASHNLMPQSLDEDGLSVSLAALIHQLDESGIKTKFHFITNLSDFQRFPKNIEIGIYRIAQEAANNVVKYAEASQAIFKLVLEENVLKLFIKDNGKGFDPAAPRDRKESVGLIGMRNRAVSFGGHLELKSWPDRGTSIAVRVETSEL